MGDSNPAEKSGNGCRHREMTVIPVPNLDAPVSIDTVRRSASCGTHPIFI